MTGRRCNQHSRLGLPAGFTLVEVLVVLIILGLATAVALPTLHRSPESLRLEVTTRSLASALRLSRATAIARHSDIVFSIDAEKRTYQSPVVPLTHIDPEIAIELVVAAPQRRSRSSGGFRFFPDGTSTGGHVDLALGNHRARVVVNWLTGEARIDFMNEEQT